MFPTRIEWHDVACFKGQHSLTLKAMVHAVTARSVDDVGRSNWLGKSTLLTLIPFALFGWHLKRTDDEWINDDAKACGVKLTLSDGAVVERMKQRGQSVQIRFTAPGGKPLTQKAAQAAIVRHIGLTADDYFATCHFEQKQLARLVTARAGDRVDIIDGWLQDDIEPIQRMHDRALADLADLSAKHAKAEADAVSLRDDGDALVESYRIANLGQSLLPAMDAVCVNRHMEADAAAAKVAKLQKRHDKRHDWEAKATQAVRFNEVVSEGKNLRDEFDQLTDAGDELLAAIDAAEQARSSRDAVHRDLRRVEDLDCGQFDGQCPVMRAACPVADDVRASGPGKGALKQLRAKLAECEAVFTAAANKRRATSERGSQQTRIDLRLRDLRKEAKRLKPAAAAIAKRGQPPAADVVQSGLSNARDAELAARMALEDATRDRDWLKDAKAQMDKLRRECDKLTSQIGLQREAVAILGREGAQKRVAVLALGHIEAGANALLAASGVALSVRFIWAREGKGAAKVCNQCGSAFPASARVKECLRCSAKRGPHMIAKLDIELTNRSGAAEDLAGIAVQLAASNWLRAKRGTPWAAACIDEPFGALDATNKRALAVHVATMLRDRFDLALVVAHDRGILDALPAQVAIVADASGSRLER